MKFRLIQLVGSAGKKHDLWGQSPWYIWYHARKGFGAEVWHSRSSFVCDQYNRPGSDVGHATYRDYFWELEVR